MTYSPYANEHPFVNSVRQLIGKHVEVVSLLNDDASISGAGTLKEFHVDSELGYMMRLEVDDEDSFIFFKEFFRIDQVSETKDASE